MGNQIFRLLIITNIRRQTNRLRAGSLLVFTGTGEGLSD